MYASPSHGLGFTTPPWGRINRIARGSGRSVAEVNELLKAYNKFEEMVRKVGKMRFKQMAKDPSAMMRGAPCLPPRHGE